MKSFGSRFAIVGRDGDLRVALIVGYLLMLAAIPQAHADGAMSANQYNTMPANTNACDSVTVTNASTFICSNDTWGVGMLICNDSASKVYLAIGVPAVSGKGIPLAPGEKTPLPYPSTGPVSGISTASASVTFCRGWKN